jgi:hypothetical protein
VTGPEHSALNLAVPPGNRMNMTKCTVWRAARAAVALLLGALLAAAAIAHNGFSVGNASTIIAYVVVSLSVIYVSIWRRWDAEIVGWVLLAIFFIGLSMA